MAQNSRQPPRRGHRQATPARKSSRTARLKVTLRLETPDIRPVLRAWLVPQLKRLISLAGLEACTLNLVVVNDRAMARFHEQFSGVPGTTDVLTFDLRDDPAAPPEADLVLCLDEAARQAAAHGHAVRLEVLLYALHGLLHLVGYDDHSPRQRSAMHRREDELLTLAGFDALYAKARK